MTTNTGTYTLSVRDITSPPDDPPDDSGNVSEGDSEDLPADTTTTGKVEVGGSVTGNITSNSDKDWFAVGLEVGKRYQIDLEGADTNRGTLTDPFLNAMRDASDNSISGTGNDDSGIRNNARTIFTAPADGTHYVVAAGNGATGTYTLSVIVLGANGASEADFDFPDDNTTSGRVDVGASATGNIGADGDADWFRVDLEKDKTYQFEVEGADTNRGTLEEPYVNLYDDMGEFPPVSGFTDLDNDLDNRFTYSVTTAGTYYVEAIEAGGASSVTTGTYTLSVRDITPPPDDPPDDSGNVSEGDSEDLPADTTTTGKVEVGGSVTGNITSNSDKDWFAVGLEVGKRYQIDLEGADTNRGTLTDPLLNAMRDASDNAVAGTANDDGGSGDQRPDDLHGARGRRSLRSRRRERRDGHLHAVGDPARRQRRLGGFHRLPSRQHDLRPGRRRGLGHGQHRRRR